MSGRFYDRIDPYWIDFEMIPVLQVRKWKSRIWADLASSLSSSLLCRQNRRLDLRNFSGRIEKVCREVNRDSQVGIMIKSDAQRERTAAQIEGFRQVLK
jgi:hypothetical protein